MEYSWVLLKDFLRHVRVLTLLENILDSELNAILMSYIIMLMYAATLDKPNLRLIYMLYLAIC